MPCAAVAARWIYSHHVDDAVAARQRLLGTIEPNLVDVEAGGLPLPLALVPAGRRERVAVEQHIVAAVGHPAKGPIPAGPRLRGRPDDQVPVADFELAPVLEATLLEQCLGDAHIFADGARSWGRRRRRLRSRSLSSWLIPRPDSRAPMGYTHGANISLNSASMFREVASSSRPRRLSSRELSTVRI